MPHIFRRVVMASWSGNSPWKGSWLIWKIMTQLLIIRDDQSVNKQYNLSPQLVSLFEYILLPDRNQLLSYGSPSSET